MLKALDFFIFSPAQFLVNISYVRFGITAKPYIILCSILMFSSIMYNHAIRGFSYQNIHIFSVVMLGLSVIILYVLYSFMGSRRPNILYHILYPFRVVTVLATLLHVIVGLIGLNFVSADILYSEIGKDIFLSLYTSTFLTSVSMTYIIEFVCTTLPNKPNATKKKYRLSELLVKQVETNPT